MNFLSLFTNKPTPPPTPQHPPSTIKRQRRVPGHWTSPINPQQTSPLFTKLPAEIRNKIYTHVFTNSPTSNRANNHPLSLLLTCRLVSTESSTLAFATHTFHIAGDLTFHGLRLRAKRLPDVYFDVISSVKCTPWPHGMYLFRYWGPNNRIATDQKFTAEVVRNIVLLLPGIRTIEIVLGDEYYGRGDGGREWRVRAREYVENIKGGEWSWSWDGDGDGDVDGVRSAVLQEIGSGRMVGVEISRGRGDVRWDDDGVGRLGLRLRTVEGGKRDDVVEVRKRAGVVGFRYDPGEEYWADLRNRREVEKRGEVDRGRDVDVWRDDCC